MTPWTAAQQASLSFTISRSLFKLMLIESMMISNHLILCCPFLLLPSNFHSISFFFPTSWPFASHSQSIGASVSALVLPMNIQGWFPLELTGLISLLSRWLSRSSPALQYERIDSYIDWKDIFLTESLYYRKLYTRKNRDLKMIKCEKHLG